MSGSRLTKGLGVFVIVVAVIVAGTVTVGMVSSDASESSAQPTAPAFDTDSLLPSTLATDGRVEAPSDGESKTVVVDASHGNAVTTSAIQPLVDALTRAGHEVRLSTDSSSSMGGLTGSSSDSGLNTTLRGADAFVVVNPGSAFTPDEIDGVEAFADAGGRVLLLADPVGQSSSGSTALLPTGSSTTASATPGQPTNLAARFGIAFGSGYLYNMSENANNFQSVYASPTSDDALADTSSEVVFRDTTPLTVRADATSVLTSDATLSTSRRADAYTVAARAGNVAAVGDTDFLAPDSATVAGNDQFASNLAAFLVTGEKQPGVPAPAEDGPGLGNPGVGAPAPGDSGNGTAAPA